MKEIVLKVPDQKVGFVLELIKQLGLDVEAEEIKIPEDHKKIVRERMSKSKENPGRLEDWSEAENSIRLD